MLAVIALAITGCMPLRNEPISSNASLVETVDPPQMRPCRSDRIFIDVPLHLEVQWNDLGFLSQLREDLGQIAATDEWFCNGKACPGEPIRVMAESVLPPHTMFEPRADGHLRFLRIWFVGEETEAEYTLSDFGACSAVEWTRELVANVTNVSSDLFYVGRECDFSTMSLQASPSQDMLAWHTRRLGLPDAVLSALPPTETPLVDLGIIDTGIDPAVSTAIGVADTANFGGGPVKNDHGTVVGIVARQVSKEARIIDVKATDSAGVATSEAVTRSLDHLLFGPTASALASVINFSMGSPPELSRRTVITAGTCSSWEDPFGESVRYMLDNAARLDATGVRPVFVSVAAGNRPLEIAPGTFPPTYSATHSCSTQSLGPDEWFLPGHWHRLDSCRQAPLGGTNRLAFATSAIDARHNPASASIAAAEAPLVAPGQHIIVAHPAAAPAPSQCTTTPPSSVTLPSTMSGSSMSSIIGASAGAHIQHTLIATNRAPFDAFGVGRFLHLTGIDVCRTSATGAPVRRIHVGRLDTALAQCPDLVNCARTQYGDEPIPADLLWVCAAPLAACGLETLDATGHVIPQCATAGGAPVSVPIASDTSCVQNSGTVTAIPASACGTNCPDAPTTDRYSLGSLGPQPFGGGCPHCEVIDLLFTPRTLRIYADLNPDFAQTTTMTSPTLALKGPTNQGVQTFFVDLDEVSPAPWHPGEYRKITVTIQNDIDFSDWSQVDAYLLVDINEGAKTVTDVSPLVWAGP